MAIPWPWAAVGPLRQPSRTAHSPVPTRKVTTGLRAVRRRTRRSPLTPRRSRPAVGQEPGPWRRSPRAVPASAPAESPLARQVLDEVGPRGGEQGVGGEVAVGQAGDLLQDGSEQAVPPLVVIRPVRAAVAAAVLQGQRERPVVELEAQDGIEQGAYAVLRRGPGPQRRRARLDGLPDRFEPRLVQRAQQPGAITEGPEERALADSGRRRDVGHRDVLRTRAAAEEGIGSREYGLPVADGVLAGRLAFGHAAPSVCKTDPRSIS